MIGERFVRTIADMNENGAGIVRIDRMAVFIPGLVPGDEAEFEIVSQEKNYAVGKCVRLITPSGDRIPDECPSCEECGGCTLGHISYETENRIKRNTVASAFRRAGLDPALVRETLAAPERNGYRNKLGVHYDPASGRFGLYREHTTDVIPFRGCLICPESLNRVVRFTNDSVELLRGSEPESLFIRTSDSGTAVSVYVKKDTELREYRDALNEAFPEGIEVYPFLSGKETGKKQYIHDTTGGIRMRFTTEAFRQVNRAAFELLLEQVQKFAAEEPFCRGADLYCGSGVIGLSLAKRFPEVPFTGIEINADAVADAKANAAANGIENMEFFCGDSADFRAKISKDDLPDWIIVDPPRAGLSKKMREELTNLSPKRICYVSCNPQTLARDLSELCRSGYTVRHAVPVNMFPRTRHIETVVQIQETGD